MTFPEKNDTYVIYFNTFFIKVQYKKSRKNYQKLKKGVDKSPSDEYNKEEFPF